MLQSSPAFIGESSTSPVQFPNFSGLHRSCQKRADFWCENMCDSMAICLSDVLNDSCFPRTLGSEVEPPLSSYIPDITVGGVFKFLGMVIGATFALCLTWFSLKLWFVEYKLQYFLRMNFCLFLSINILDKLLGDGTVIHKEYNTYSALLWNYSAIATLVMLFTRYHWKLELNITRQYHEVGLETHKKRDAIIRDRMRRLYVTMDLDLDLFPPCFPNGWIPIMESRALKSGQVKGVNALGHRFCAFRAEKSDTVFVTDAYCPHLGADLTMGGKVRGNCIECAFHGWLADGKDGTCTRGPSKDPKKEMPPVPPGIKLRKWHACDVNGSIYVWYHAEEDQQEPYWEMPRVEEICNGQWVYRGRTEHVVHCHIQEIPENGADINHLEQLHSASVLLGCNWMDTKSWFNVVSHDWEPEWRRDEAHPHIARIRLRQRTTVLGLKIPFSTLDMDIKQIGPATVHLHFNSWFGHGILTQHIIPEGPLTHRIIHHLYTEPAIKPFWAEFLIRGEAIMLERDIVVWNHKKYLKNPMLLKDEKNIREYRKWYKQFYSTNSPRISDLNRACMKLLDC